MTEGRIMKIQSDIQGRLLLHLSQDRLVRDSSGNCECRKNFHHKDQGDGAANKKKNSTYQMASRVRNRNGRLVKNFESKCMLRIYAAR